MLLKFFTSLFSLVVCAYFAQVVFGQEEVREGKPPSQDINSKLEQLEKEEKEEQDKKNRKDKK